MENENITDKACADNENIAVNGETENSVKDVEENISNSSIKRKRKIDSVINIILIVLVVLLAARLLFNVFFNGIYVVGESMMPTIVGAEQIGDEIQAGGDYVFINKYDKPDYGDIVVIDSGEADKDGNPKVIIKRVIALDGDSVYMDRGDVFLKKEGEAEYTKLNEAYIDPTRNTDDLRNTLSIVEVEGIFVLGDNRDNSKDSRDYGNFSLENVYGVVTDWSISLKGAISSAYNFLKFHLNLPI